MERVSIIHLPPSGWLTLQGNAAVLGTELRYWFGAGARLSFVRSPCCWIHAQPLLLPPWLLLLGLLRKHWGGRGKSLTSTDLCCCSLDDREAPLQWMPSGVHSHGQKRFSHTASERSSRMPLPRPPCTLFSRYCFFQVNHYPLTRTQHISMIWAISQCRWRRQSNVLVRVVSWDDFSSQKYSGMLFLGDVRLKSSTDAWRLMSCKPSLNLAQVSVSVIWSQGTRPAAIVLRIQEEC